MAIDLAGRVCLITGAGQGIGAGIANGFVERGAVVVATDISEPSCAGAAARLAWNVGQANRAEEIVREVVQRFGRLDAFIANAGIMPRQEWDSITPADWERMLRINLDGAWYGAQAAARPMVEQGYGKIVFVSSVEVVMGVAVHCHYDATKAGLIGLTRSLARAVGKQGVRVNCVMPGAVRTEAELAFNVEQTAIDQLLEQQCLPGRIEAKDIEQVFAFLCGAESDIITGQVICADHGLVHW